MQRHKWPLINWKAINLKTLVQPLLGVLLFLGLWQWGASQVQTSLGTLPGPVATASQLWSLGQDHLAERDKAAAFLEGAVPPAFRVPTPNASDTLMPDEDPLTELDFQDYEPLPPEE